MSLEDRIQQGGLDPKRVELAARLGHPGALVLYPEVEQVDWGDKDERRKLIASAAVLLGETLPARVAADWAERVVHLFEAEHPEDARPREAIAAARAWADCPCEDHAHAAAAQAAWAAWAAEAAALAAALAALAAALAAGDAALAAARAASAAARAAARAAASAAEDAGDKWQQLRLAAYLLGDSSDQLIR